MEKKILVGASGLDLAFEATSLMSTLEVQGFIPIMYDLNAKGDVDDSVDIAVIFTPDAFLDLDVLSKIISIVPQVIYIVLPERVDLQIEGVNTLALEKYSARPIISRIIELTNPR